MYLSTQALSLEFEHSCDIPCFIFFESCQLSIGQNTVTFQFFLTNYQFLTRLLATFPRVLVSCFFIHLKAIWQVEVKYKLTSPSRETSFHHLVPVYLPTTYAILYVILYIMLHFSPIISSTFPVSSYHYILCASTYPHKIYHPLSSTSRTSSLLRLLCLHLLVLF